MQLELFRADYHLRERLSAKARHIRVEVRSGREVLLVYPRWVRREEALAFLQSREAWVRERLAEFARREAASPPPPPASWDGRDEIPLRGTLVPVCVEAATLRQIQVRIEADVITVFAPKSSTHDRTQKLELALRRELMRHAQRDADRLLQEEALRLGVTWRELSIGDPRTQWGSCGAHGEIALSWRLVMAPPAVFRYVVVHELCHRVHMDHSAQFWTLLEQQMPDFPTHKRWLNEQGQRLHHYLPWRRQRQGA